MLSEANEKGVFFSRDGTRLYYETRGQGLPLVLCYGLTCKMEHWRHQIGYFSNSYQVILVDYRGHHRSGLPKNEKNLTLQWCANDVEDLIRYLKLKRVVALGHSMGVSVLTHLAISAPELIGGLIFVCGTVDNPFHHMFHSDKLDTVFDKFSKIYRVAPALTARLWHQATKRNRLNTLLTKHFGFNPRLSSERDVHRYMEGVHESPLQTFQSLLADYRQFDGRDIIRKIECPTLVVAGEDDWITPMALSEEMARLIPKGELVKVPEGSHNAHMDRPGVVNKRIEHFLEEIGYR